MKLQLFQLALLTPAVTALWPIPSSYSSGETVLWIGEDVQVKYNGVDVSERNPAWGPDDDGDDDIAHTFATYRPTRTPIPRPRRRRSSRLP